MQDDLWTKERDDRMTALIEQGNSASQIALILGEGITRSSVLGRVNRLRANGSKIVKGPRNGRGLNDEIRQQILKLVNSDLTNDALAKQFNIRYSAVISIFQHAGLKRPPSQGKKLGFLQQSIRRKIEAEPQPVSNEFHKIMDRFKEGYNNQMGRVGIGGLHGGMCRYPIDQPEGGIGYCGLEAAGTYCAEHHARCNDGFVKTRTTGWVSGPKRLA